MINDNKDNSFDRLWLEVTHLFNGFPYEILNILMLIQTKMRKKERKRERHCHDRDRDDDDDHKKRKKRFLTKTIEEIFLVKESCFHNDHKLYDHPYLFHHSLPLFHY